MRKIRTGGAAVAMIAIMAVFATTASAHARYKSSTPGTGEVLTASPARVAITFTQEIQKIAGTYDIQVGRDRGQSVASGPAVIDDADRSTMSVPLRPDLPPGRYVVNWKNISDADGDPAEGAFSFYVNTQPNAVDRQNDEQLAAIGAEAETPTAAAASGTAAPATSAATSATTGTARPVTAPTPASSDGGGNDSEVIYIVIGGVLAAVALAVGGWFVLGRRGA